MSALPKCHLCANSSDPRMSLTDWKREGHLCDPNNLIIYEIDKLRKSAAVSRERVGRALVGAVFPL